MKLKRTCRVTQFHHATYYGEQLVVFVLIGDATWKMKGDREILPLITLLKWLKLSCGVTTTYMNILFSANPRENCINITMWKTLLSGEGNHGKPLLHGCQENSM